jgi:hypothetical protein
MDTSTATAVSQPQWDAVLRLWCGVGTHHDVEGRCQFLDDFQGAPGPIHHWSRFAPETTVAQMTAVWL